jgi:aerobic C4-dicarboxylate transport protein
MASLFIADAMDQPMSIGQQIGLLLFMMVASKGAAGVSGSGIAVLASGLQSHKPALVDWTGEVDKERVDRVLAGELPFDEKTLLDEKDGDDHLDGVPEQGGEKELAKA